MNAGVVIIDASAFVELLLRTNRADSVIQAVAGRDMVAPDLLTVEVLSVLRRLERSGTLNPARATQAITDLAHAPLRRLPTLSLLADVWALRANVSAYDASYIATARALNCPLVSADVRLTRAPGLGVSIIAV